VEVVEYQLKIEHEQLRQAVEPFLRAYGTTAERVAAIEAALRGETGKVWRDELAKWTVRVVPVELLVPDVYAQWRPLVRVAMMFVVSRLSPRRLAPKVVEQMELPADTVPEARLLRFIAKVPGLQKIGQVLARNRNLNPKMRRALTELENGIADVSIDEIRTIILQEVGSQFATYAVEMDSTILSEASVSAVVGFTWRNPETRRRERGVFKVLKPHIPGCYAEDMKILQQLAGYLAHKYRGEGVRLAGVAETLTEIRLLLQREVDFPGEQATLLNALGAYRSIPGVRVPRLIPPLSTATVTALTRERGVKVTEAVARPKKLRVRLAERLVEALVAVPALSRREDMIFHADPHAGNLLYDKRRGELVILDWALTGRLALQQRRCVFMLVLMTMLRDADGMRSAIERLRLHGSSDDRRQASIIRERVTRLLDGLPLWSLPGPMEAMRVLDEVALNGIRFPASLLMFRKAWFTLEGILEDVSRAGVRMDSIIARYALANWPYTGAALLSLLSPSDWVALDWSTLKLASRWYGQALFRLWQWVRQTPQQVASAPEPSTAG
jgi:predicted unusual protein kinase regulating ubiquinone biosynthesis (AarF/ABC1/UbiB family)